MKSNRKLALLGALIAVNVLARLLGPGFGGVEPIFALLILQGYVLGVSYGAALGALSLLTSALLTGGVGPWLPFQMLGAATVASGAGLLPLLRKRSMQLAVVSLWGIVAAFIYGATVTLWQWPLLAGSSTSLSFQPTRSFGENFIRFVQYSIFSGGLLWDTGRAITTVVVVLAFGKTILAALERAANRIGVLNQIRKSARLKVHQQQK